MDPFVKSTLTTVLMNGATVAATWGAAHGLVPQADVTSAENILVTMAFAGITAVIGWYKAHQHTPQANIDAINKPFNGLKVVPFDSPTPAVVVAPKKD